MGLFEQLVEESGEFGSRLLFLCRVFTLKRAVLLLIVVVVYLYVRVYVYADPFAWILVTITVF